MQGLHPNISMGPSFSHFPSLDDAIQIAYQIDENLNSISYKKPFMESAPRSVMANNGYSNSKAASKPQVNDASSSVKPAHNYTPPRSRDFEGCTSVSKGSQCHICKGYGCFKAQCPNRVVGLSNK